MDICPPIETEGVERIILHVQGLSQMPDLFLLFGGVVRSSVDAKSSSEKARSEMKWFPSPGVLTPSACELLADAKNPGDGNH